jgi:hypothetical protein
MAFDRHPKTSRQGSNPGVLGVRKAAGEPISSSPAAGSTSYHLRIFWSIIS